MSVRFFTCQNCKNPSSEYNEIFCEKCESQMCSCALPAELKDFLNIWEDVWEYIEIDGEDNIIPKSEECDKEAEIIRKYLTFDCKGYGLELKKEFCPVCNKERQDVQDPEYKEYLRLKKKFEK